jgi:hypothetical protein
MKTYLLLLESEGSRHAHLFQSDRLLSPAEAIKALKLDPEWLEDDCESQVSLTPKIPLVPVADESRKVLRTVPGVANFVETREPRYHIATWKELDGSFGFQIRRSEADLRREDFLRVGADVPAGASILVETGFAILSFGSGRPHLPSQLPSSPGLADDRSAGRVR